MFPVISLGGLNIPFLIVFISGAVLSVYLAGRISLRGDKENSRIFSNILSSPVLPFLLLWKLSLVLTDFQDVLSNPSILLFSRGSMVNAAIGAAGGIAWGLWRGKRLAPPPRVIRALLISAAAAVLIFSLTGLVFVRAQNKKSSAAVSALTADFTSPDGTVWNTGMAAGRPLILNFWASWCPPCRAEMPMLSALFSKETAEGIFADTVFYAVNMTSLEKKPDDGIQWLQSEELSMPLLLDVNGTAQRVYGVSSLPTTIIFDAEGREISRKTGTVSRGMLKSALHRAGR